MVATGLFAALEAGFLAVFALDEEVFALDFAIEKDAMNNRSSRRVKCPMVEMLSENYNQGGLNRPAQCRESLL